MPEGRKEEYIQVIVPLKLDWCPTYRVPEKWHGSLQVGDRVKVRVGPRLTDAIVSRTGVSPDIDPARIHDIVAREEGLERITPEEIRLWQFIADYYLCTLGEVFKCAYPSGKIRSEETAAKARERAETSRRKLMEAALQRISKLEAEIEDVKRRTEEALAKLTDRGVKTRAKLTANRDARLARLQEAIDKTRSLLDTPDKKTAGSDAPLRETDTVPEALWDALKAGKPVLLQGPSPVRYDCYMKLLADTLARQRTALLLVPEIALTESFEDGMKARFGSCTLVFHSRETTVQRRKIADRLRDPGPHLLIGTRSALFLPFHNLGLVIVDEEQDRSYKQDSPAPRYNARDCAVVLAGIHGADVLLGSGAPSLESLYNCNIRRYTGVTLEPDVRPVREGRLLVIDTVSERRKRGMKGSFSIKLLDQIRYTLDQGGNVYLIRLWGDTSQTVEETRALFPELAVSGMEEDGLIRIGTLAQTKSLTFEEGSLVAILQADPILGAQNFRADERAFQLFERYREHCAAGTFVIQTSRSGHPVFQDLLSGRHPWEGLMEERKDFAYPPYSRIIDIDIEDGNPKRLVLMSRLLAEDLNRALCPTVGIGGPVRVEGPYERSDHGRTLRVILVKDRQFPERKKRLHEAVASFTRERKYVGFIHLDVDPE